MPSVPAHAITGATARDIARSVEEGVGSGGLAPGTPLPSVRGLARELEVSPTTVATAYRDLRTRGLVVTHERSRTVVSHVPPLVSRPHAPLPEGVRDLAAGDPDPLLLPDLAATLRTLDVPVRGYGEEAIVPELARRAVAWFGADDIDASSLVAVSGALDGIERVLGTALRVGDRVAVEDPGYTGLLDLLRAMGLVPVPVPVDDDGLDPDVLAGVVGGCEAVLLTPRAHNPTGAAMTAERADALRTVLDDVPGVLVVEDDHAADIAGAPARTLTRGRERWAVVRSLAKTLGPDLRVAVVAGDERTVTRLATRLRVGPGWVSTVLQHLAVALWDAAAADGGLERAAATYAERRRALLDALDGAGIPASGRTGLNVWVPVPEETPVVRGLLDRGWAVQAGERYRLAAPPAIRVTVARLEPADAGAVAAAFADVLRHGSATRLG
ncbi:MAG: aminotransferase class I/II-fold pyridoxal phosphate-dependent enzyme [Actinobacteria bacterium]|nr:aminotransferase class I/II-fold pyridoxal phosphate-dependent enzyme [Actinomycetota bacterium]